MTNENDKLREILKDMKEMKDLALTLSENSKKNNSANAEKKEGIYLGFAGAVSMLRANLKGKDSFSIDEIFNTLDSDKMDKDNDKNT